LLDAAGLERAANAAWPDGGDRRCYRLIHTTFEVTLPTALEAIVRPVLEHLEVADTPVADVQLHVRASEGGCVIFDGLAPVMACEAIDRLVPSLKLLLRRLAVARHRYFMEIHAGVVVLGDNALLLAGSAGSGKTTLTAALAHGGALYFSDEIALLEETTLDVRPLPLTLTIKQGSVGPLRDLYPNLVQLDEHLREDRQWVRYLPPPRQGRCAADEDPRPVRWVVFPSYDPGAETTLTPLKRARGLRRLLDESLVLPQLLDCRNVERLVGWTRQLEFYELRMSSLEAAVRLIRQVT
jgi:hypothetical protein